MGKKTKQKQLKTETQVAQELNEFVKMARTKSKKWPFGEQFSNEMNTCLFVIGLKKLYAGINHDLGSLIDEPAGYTIDDIQKSDLKGVLPSAPPAKYTAVYLQTLRSAAMAVEKTAVNGQKVESKNETDDLILRLIHYYGTQYFLAYYQGCTFSAKETALQQFDGWFRTITTDL